MEAPVGRGSVFVLPAAARDWSLGLVQIVWADAALCAKLIFYHGLVLYTSDIKLVVQSCLKKVRRGALRNHFPLYLTHNWTGPISCQNKYGGDSSEVIKHVLWISEDAWMREYYSTPGQESVGWGSTRVHARFCVSPQSACKGVNVAVQLKKSRLSNCHFGGDPGRAGGIMGVV